jgi:hypothetical protein
VVHAAAAAAAVTTTLSAANKTQLNPYPNSAAAAISFSPASHPTMVALAQAYTQHQSQSTPQMYAMAHAVAAIQKLEQANRILQAVHGMQQQSTHDGLQYSQAVLTAYAAIGGLPGAQSSALGRMDQSVVGTGHIATAHTEETQAVLAAKASSPFADASSCATNHQIQMDPSIRMAAMHALSSNQALVRLSSRSTICLRLHRWAHAAIRLELCVTPVSS